MADPWSRCLDDPRPPANCASAASIPPSCDDPVGETCYHCNPGAQGATDACTPEQDRCTGLGALAITDPSSWVPHVCLSWGNNAWDASGSREPFYTTNQGLEGGRGGGVYRYVILSTFAMYADKCSTHRYCQHAGDLESHWLCRALIHGELNTGWRMLCAEVTPDNLYDPMPMILERDIIHNGLIFVLLALQGDPQCFAPVQDVFAFTQWCEEDWWECAGDVARALDWLEVDLDVRFSDDQTVYPRSNPYERTLENAAWWTACQIVDVLDGHDAGLDYDDPHKSLWSMVEWFDGDNVTLHQLGLPAYPPIHGRPPDDVVIDGYYPEYAATEIPITCHGYISKIQVPAVLTLHYLSMRAQLHPEQALVTGDDPFEMRVHANVDIRLALRVRLLPEAVDLLEAAGHTLLVQSGDSYLYDLRLADPDHPTEEHPHERLVAKGPNGERVPRELSWRGLRTHRTYARVPCTQGRGFDFTAPGGNDYPYGCAAVNAINGLVVHGQLNDTREYDPETATATELPQFCVGQVVFGVSSLLDNRPGVHCLP